MSRLAPALLTCLLLAVGLPMMADPSEAAGTPIKFGMSAGTVGAQTNAGVKPDYGTFWIGPWTLKSGGWGGPDTQLTNLKSAGVTPAIHFYYWGDDISPSCVENGCWSSLHNAQKDREHWDLLASQLTDHLNSKMGGAPVLIFLESEFNKGGIETYEPFDAYLEAMAKKIHAAYPNAVIVLGFGNWGSVYWGTFDRAAAASDMVGVQSMRGSTRQSKTDMMTLYDSLLSGVKTLGAKFPGKAIMITDVAVSSYPEPEYLSVQHDVVKEVFDNLGTLKAAGVRALVYRNWLDTPTMDTANWYGEAERHWGFAWAGNGTHKPVAKVWVDGVKAERAGTTSTTSTGSTAFTATVTPSLNSNEWWIQVGVQPEPAKVETKVGTGSYVAMDRQSYGWTKSRHAPSGTPVQFRVTSLDGQVATTPAQAWLVDMSPKEATVSSPGTTSTTTSPTASTSTSTASTTGSASGFTATVTPSGNEWWVQANLATSASITKVEAKAGSGSWIALNKESYGWAKSFNVPKGTVVQFRLTASDGSTASTAGQAWLVDMAPQSATSATGSTTTTTTGSTQSSSTGAATTSTTSSPVPTTSATSTSSGSTSASVSTTSATATSSSSTTSATNTTSSSQTTSATSTSSPSSSSTAFMASFVPKSVGMNWWVEVAVEANAPLALVEAKTNNGIYVPLTPTADGTYAASMHAPKGAKVTFRATSISGETVTSGAYSWRL